MQTLPLFPLNTVLFPGMPLSLHIFEDRYKQMINYCLETREPFGVVLIESGAEALGPLAQPHLIGCTAHITQVQPLAGGRMNIIAVGQDRFQIESLNFETESYLTGQVEILPLQNDNPDALVPVGHKLRPLLKHYLQLLAQADNLQFDFQQLPTDALALVYLAAFLLQIPADQKQELLDMMDARELAGAVLAAYRRETVLLDAMLRQKVTDDNGLFSLN